MNISKDSSLCLKGIAIALVVACHLMGWFGFENVDILNLMGTGGCCLFLMLSGYGVYRSYAKKGLSKEYFNNKIYKVFIPYWIITLVYIILYKREITKLCFIKTFFLTDYERYVDGTMWYLSLLLILYVLFFIIFSVNGINDLIKIVLLLIMSVGLWYMAKNQVFLNCSWQIERNSISFVLGVIIGYVNVKIPRLSSKVSELCVIVFSLLAYCALYKTRFRTDFQLMGILFCLFIIFTIIKIERIFPPAVKLIGEIGGVSLYIYLLEAKVMDQMKSISPEPNLRFLIVYLLILSILVGVYSNIFKPVLSYGLKKQNTNERCTE